MSLQIMKKFGQVVSLPGKFFRQINLKLGEHFQEFGTFKSHRIVKLLLYVSCYPQLIVSFIQLFTIFYLHITLYINYYQFTLKYI